MLQLIPMLSSIGYMHFSCKTFDADEAMFVLSDVLNNFSILFFHYISPIYYIFFDFSIFFIRGFLGADKKYRFSLVHQWTCQN